MTIMDTHGIDLSVVRDALLARAISHQILADHLLRSGASGLSLIERSRAKGVADAWQVISTEAKHLDKGECPSRFAPEYPVNGLRRSPGDVAV